jgi:signal transduction histidine kinase
VTDITETKLAQEERARFINQLRTAADISERISAILDLDLILHEVVTLLQERFKLYYVSIFLLAETTRELIIRAGSGEVGKLLRQRGNKIALDNEQSLMARAARDHEIVLVNDVSLEPTYLPNPLLPETRAKMVVPLIASSGVLGVLDVEDNHIGRFSQSDLDTFSILSGQIAIALENAHLFAERMRAERALALARDQALEASRLKSQLLANVSHDLRTPLGAILGHTEMLQRGIYGVLLDKQLSITQRIISNTTNLTEMVNKLLDEAQLEAGTLQLAISSFAPTELIEQLQTTVKVLAEAKGLQLSCHIAPDVPPNLSGDPDRLHQILTNLVGNAIKFTEQGAVKVHIYRPDKIHWAMQVSDTGPGIPAEAQSYIFEAFRQVDGTATRKHGGSGLGLSIVKQLTSMMGGQVMLESKIEQGSTFTILLPLGSTQETIIL